MRDFFRDSVFIGLHKTRVLPLPELLSFVSFNHSYSRLRVLYTCNNRMTANDELRIVWTGTTATCIAVLSEFA